MAAYRAMQELRNRMVWVLGANVFQRLGRPSIDWRNPHCYAAANAEHENRPHGAQAMTKPAIEDEDAVQRSDAYGYACDTLEEWHRKRARKRDGRAKIRPVTQMSLCDGLASLLEMVDKLEDEASKP